MFALAIFNGFFSAILVANMNGGWLHWIALANLIVAICMIVATMDRVEQKNA